MIPTITASPSGSVSKKLFLQLLLVMVFCYSNTKSPKQVGDKYWLDSRPRCSVFYFCSNLLEQKCFLWECLASIGPSSETPLIEKQLEVW